MPCFLLQRKRVSLSFSGFLVKFTESLQLFLCVVGACGFCAICTSVEKSAQYRCKLHKKSKDFYTMVSNENGK